MAVVATELPEGTVTLLFSDIEGSTALPSPLGVQYAHALSAQRVLLREAFGRGGGRELGTEGDSFYVVFESAVDAVVSCVAAQRAVVGYVSPGGATARMRMRMHPGAPARATVTREKWDAEQFAGRARSDQHVVELMTADNLRQVM